MFYYFHPKNSNEYVSAQIFYRGHFYLKDRKLGVVENVACSLPTTMQTAKSLFSFSTRKGELYGKGQIECEKEIYLDNGYSFRIHIYGKAEIFYF